MHFSSTLIHCLSLLHVYLDNKPFRGERYGKNDSTCTSEMSRHVCMDVFL